MDALQHCFPPNLHRLLNELPKSLDETYGRILKGINEAQWGDAHRLLQCLTVAARPLRVDEIAELLASDFQAPSAGGVPKVEDWRWIDHEEAVLSICSSLIAIVPSGDSRVVQFSHFSVKEYLTSPRLARSHGDVSRFHIDLKAAHTIMAQACLATLLQLDERAENGGSKGRSLAKYAAQHWVEHAQFENVSSRVHDMMDDLFDASKPHFAAWLRVHDIDESWDNFSLWSSFGAGSPLYYAAFCGFYDLVERLITKNPEEVHKESGWIIAPLFAALYKRHFRVADLLHRHGAAVYVQGHSGGTPLHAASALGQVDIMRWLLNHGANANDRDGHYWTPLHRAAIRMRLEAVQVLLDHNPDINSRTDEGDTVLSMAIDDDSVSSVPGKEFKVDIDIVRLLLEHGADPNIPDSALFHSTPLHRASSGGWLEVARLLLTYGAKIDEKDREGRTPFHVASSIGHLDIMKFLSENGAVLSVRDHKETTPLHEASARGHIDVMRWLLNRGADANARQGDRCTPLHLAAYMHLEAVEVLLIHNAEINLQDDMGQTPLYTALTFHRPSPREGVVDIVRRLLEHGADPNIRNYYHSTALHEASSGGLLDAARLLLSYGANVNEKDGKGRSPLQVAASNGDREMTKLMLEHSNVP